MKVQTYKDAEKLKRNVMDKITCPHCGAVNQDVTTADSCWKCGKPLGASAVVTAEELRDGEMGGQKLKAQPSLEERVAQRKEERLASRRASSVTPIIVVLLLLLIALLLYFYVFRHR